MLLPIQIPTLLTLHIAMDSYYKLLPLFITKCDKVYCETGHYKVRCIYYTYRRLQSVISYETLPVNSASSEILMILWLYRSILEWFYLTRERGSSTVKCETEVQLGKSDVAYQTEMLEGKTPMSHCETLTSHRKQQCWIIKLKCRHGQQQFWITKLKCRMAKNRVKS